jgi:hypothetical protein
MFTSVLCLSCSANYHDLHRHSVEDDNFWLELWEFLGIISSVPPQKVCYLLHRFLHSAQNRITDENLGERRLR